MEVYESADVTALYFGGAKEQQIFSSSTIDFIYIGGQYANTFYESYIIGVTPTILYAWGRDSVRNVISNKIVNAVTFELIEF